MAKAQFSMLKGVGIMYLIVEREKQYSRKDIGLVDSDWDC